MNLLKLEGPFQEPVTDDEAKLYLRVEHSLDDHIIRMMIAAARSMVEAYTGQTLIEQKWRLTIDAHDGLIKLIKLPLAPFVRLEGRPKKIQREHTIEITNYKLRRDAGFATVELLTNLTSYDVLQLEFVVGYGETAESVPVAYKQAILMLVAEMYENRVGADTNVVMNDTVKSLLAVHRVKRLL